MAATHHPDLDDPRFPDAEAAMVAWRDLGHVQHRRVAILLVLALLVTLVVIGAAL